MPKVIIEREIPGAEYSSSIDPHGTAHNSYGVHEAMDLEIRCVEDSLNADKMHDIYKSLDRDTVDEHAARRGFPADQISPVQRMNGLTTADEPPAPSLSLVNRTSACTTP